MSLITGIARIKVNGELLESKPGAELDLGGKERELRSGHRVYGYSEKVMPAVLTCTFYWKAGAPIEAIRNLTEGLVTFESDVGETYQISNATTLKTVKVKDETGEVDVEIGGDAAELQ